MTASVEDLTAAIWKACQLLSVDESFVPDKAEPAKQLLSLCREFADETSGMMSLLVEHNARLEEMFSDLVRLSLEMAVALENAKNHVAFDHGCWVWWEEQGEPALREWQEFRGVS